VAVDARNDDRSHITMKASPVTILATAGIARAYPGMGRVVAELHKHQSRAPAGFLGSTQLLGDLNTLPDGSLTSSGAAIKAVLSGDGQPLGDAGTVYYAPGPLGSPSCSADRCCVYKYAALAMEPNFKDPTTGECTALARAALRMGFHDAGSWDVSMGYGGGGADGSVLLNPAEMGRPDNKGIVVIGNMTVDWYNQLRPYGATMADLIQLAAMTAVVSCPGGPRMRFFAGRVDNSNAAPDGFLPQPTQSPEALIDLFQRKSFTPGGLAALLGAHTVSTQFFTAPEARGFSQDGTPGVWDNNFYNATLNPGPAPAGVFRFQSDIALSQHYGTAASFQFFATSQGRVTWQQVSPLSSTTVSIRRLMHTNKAFAAEYLRASLLGVYNLNSMTDCTNILPLSTFTG